MSKPILSVVVPTKNRYETLVVLVEKLMTWQSMDFELIIQDNSDDNTPVEEILNKHREDARFIYNHYVGDISAPENCDIALKLVNGEYVCVIGDDDGITEKTIHFCRLLKEYQIDSVSIQKAGYQWPDLQFTNKLNDYLKGVFTVHQSKHIIELVDAKQELRKVLVNGADSLYNLPKLYHGLVSTASLQKLYSTHQTYIPGPVIDMASAISLVPLVNKHIHTDIPFVISGQSYKSMAGANVRRAHLGDIRKQKSLPQNTYENWSKEVPRYWSGPTIWAETAFQAARASGQGEQLGKFNFAKMYARCFSFSSSNYYSELRQHIAQNYQRGQFFIIWLKIIIELSKISFGRFINVVKKLLKNKGGQVTANFSSIAGVIDFVEDNLPNSKEIETILRKKLA